MALTGRRRILEKKDLALRPHPGARRTTRLAESSVVHPNPKPPHRPDATDKSRPSGTDLETFGRFRPAFGVGAGSTPRKSHRLRDVRPDASPRRVLARTEPPSGKVSRERATSEQCVSTKDTVVPPNLRRSLRQGPNMTLTRRSNEYYAERFSGRFRPIRPKGLFVVISGRSVGRGSSHKGPRTAICVRNVDDQ